VEIKMAVLKNYIGGEWVDGVDTIRSINPSDTNEVVAECAVASPKQVAEAVSAARQALKQWSQTTTQVRSDLLHKIGSELLERKDELGECIAREEGKTRAEGIGEIVRAAQVFRFFAGEVVRFGGEKLPSVRPNIDIEVSRSPVGVIGIITPWNFPVAIPAWKIGPALAFGNTVVFKPSELTPMMGWHLAQIVSRAGGPPGILNLVMGTGPLTGQAVVDNVDGVTFTGSVATGRQIAQRAIQRMIRLQCEMGGKNPLVVLDDADLDTAVACAVDGAFFQTGQRCTASSRLIVTEKIHDRFVDAVVERLRKLVIDNSLKPATNVGPAVDQRQLEKDLRYLDVGRREGATVKLEGGQLKRDTPGHYISPTLFVDTTNQMQINREEIFGPIAATIRVKDYDEALAIANDTEYGLSAGICTTSRKYARHFQANAQSGLVMVNLPTAGLDYHVPFGGTKASSYGPREQGRYAEEFYTIVKTSYLSV
jgi:acyl-CoA reductase-like NAD-dependent aldehyde dehydrogenase